LADNQPIEQHRYGDEQLFHAGRRVGQLERPDIAGGMSGASRVIAFHVAFMLRGAAGNFWEALKTNGNFCNTMQHEKAAKSTR
jgi:hypothetical protein